MKHGDEAQARSGDFLAERRRSRFFFNLTAPIYPLIEHHLFPHYEETLARLELSPESTVLDVATGSGILAAAFARRGHPVRGLDFSARLLKRARKRFPDIDFQALDLADLAEIPARSWDIVCCGYVLHGLSAGFRHAVLKNMARIAGRFVVVFDYCRDGGRLVRLIEWVEGPHYRQFMAAPRQVEFAAAGLRIDKSLPTSDFGCAWLCRP